MKKMFTLFAVLLLTTAGFSQTQSWSLTGNSGTTSSNFLGTTDNKPIIFKSNGTMAGFSGYEDGMYNVSFGYKSNIYPSTGGYGNASFGAQALMYGGGNENVAIGHWAMLYNTSSDNNVAVGGSAMAHSSGGSNVALGLFALMQTKTDGSVAIGTNAARLNTTGSALTAVGYQTLYNNSTGVQNSALGHNALYNNTTGSNNTAIGSMALKNNTTGVHNTTVGVNSLYNNTTGEYNTALGVQALLENTTGWWNVGLGYGTLYSNTTGFQNTAIGTSAMWFNTTGEQNVAVGERALGGNTTGSWNTAVGVGALRSISSSGYIGFGEASNNSAVGYEALREITSGSGNIAFGIHAGVNTTTGAQNIAIGNYALSQNTTGSNNIAIGNSANITSSNLTNVIVIGNNATATASNQVRIGNDQVTSIGGKVAWSTLSDGRVKQNIKQNVPGLEFINLLKPVTYNLNPQKLRSMLQKEDDESFFEDTQLHTGFVAQEVAQAAQSLGYDFSGVDTPETEDGLYALRYSEFVVPLVKAVQELSAQQKNLQSQVEELQQILKSDDVIIEQENSINVLVSSASLEQNIPNPFDNSTTIPYILPKSFSSAKIVITNSRGGQIKQIPLYQSGKGNVNVEAGLMSTGIYYYSLYVDGDLIETKKMIKK